MFVVTAISLSRANENCESINIKAKRPKYENISSMLKHLEDLQIQTTT